MMTTEQLTMLLSLYKKAIKNNLSISDFENEIMQIRLKIDASFVREGKEDMNLGEYLNELLELQTSIS